MKIKIIFALLVFTLFSCGNDDVDDAADITSQFQREVDFSLLDGTWKADAYMIYPGNYTKKLPSPYDTALFKFSVSNCDGGDCSGTMDIYIDQNTLYKSAPFTAHYDERTAPNITVLSPDLYVYYLFHSMVINLSSNDMTLLMKNNVWPWPVTDNSKDEMYFRMKKISQ